MTETARDIRRARAWRVVAAMCLALAASGARGGGQPPAGDVIHFDPGSRRVTTDVYDYVPSPANPFLFQRIDFHGATAVEDAALDLFLQPRNFFNIHLDESNLPGRVRQSALDSGRVLLDMDFLLRFLFFRIDADVSTAAVFNRDNASLPLTFKVPVDSRSVLMPGSGAFYSWKEKNARITDSSKNCSERGCAYVFSGEIGSGGGSRFAVRMDIGHDLVSQGFVPELVRDQRVLATGRGWPLLSGRGRNGPASWQGGAEARTGIYFELSGLAAGVYRVDYNIGLLPAPKG